MTGIKIFLSVVLLPISNSAANGWRTSIVDPLIYYAATTATRGIYQRFISVLSWCCGYLLNKCDLCSSTWREDPYYSRIPRCHYVFSTTLFESNSLSSTITSSNNVTCVKREYGSRRYGSMSSSFIIVTALILGGLICDRFGYLCRLSLRHDWQRIEPYLWRPMQTTEYS